MNSSFLSIMHETITKQNIICLPSSTSGDALCVYWKKKIGCINIGFHFNIFKIQQLKLNDI